MLSSAQSRFVQNFFDRYLPGQQFTEERFFVSFPFVTGRESYLGISFYDATAFALAVANPIMMDIANNLEITTQEMVNERMINAINRLNNISQPLEKSLLSTLGKDCPAVSAMAYNYFKEVSRFELPFEECFNSFRLNAKLLPAWLKAKPRKFGGFEVRNVVATRHPESIIGIQIRNPAGETIANIGGALLYHEKGIVALITNIQGEKIVRQPGEKQSSFDARKKKHLESFASLNAALGENWRVFFTKELVATAKAKGIKVVGVMPKRLGMGADVPLKEYERQLRQYAQTYRKAGLTKTGTRTGNSWHFTPQKTRHRTK